MFLNYLGSFAFNISKIFSTQAIMISSLGDTLLLELEDGAESAPAVPSCTTVAFMINSLTSIGMF